MVTVSGNANCLKLAPLQLYFWSRLQNRTTCISYGFLETDGVLTPTICVQNNDNSSVISIVFFGVMSRIIVLLSFSLRTHHNAQQLSSICNVHTLNCALKRTDLCRILSHQRDLTNDFWFSLCSHMRYLLAIFRNLWETLRTCGLTTNFLLFFFLLVSSW